ncbi:hypothetical protein O3M35_012347 [Rhynocoris fuscipes]|uniref:Glycoprotein-N-acetylgalactosamine 3-beta-galactosyltransferase 1 n=1 Tax=Rhynocoris fuscipes TaxID=488301 RepID=A0AAW1CXS9_9HEMI
MFFASFTARVKDVFKTSFLFTLLIGIISGYALGFIIFYNLTSDLKLKKVLLNKDYNFKEDLNIIDDNHVPSYASIKETEVKDDQNVRLLCWIMTQPRNHATKAVHVKATWGKRCNILLFMSSKEDDSLPAIKLPVWEGRDYLWSKTKNAFKYVYKHYFDKADWFLKADDDTYVIVENLRYLLADQNTTEPVYLGWRFRNHENQGLTGVRQAKQGFMSGGAGYVLGKNALEKFIKEALPNSEKCEQGDIGDEDIEIGKCLENVGIKAKTTRDSYGRERFFPLIPDSLLVPGFEIPLWYISFAYYKPRQGDDCCSDAAITFHYVSPEMMYVIEQFIYKIKPHGIYRQIKEISKNMSLYT